MKTENNPGQLELTFLMQQEPRMKYAALAKSEESLSSKHKA